MNRKNGTGNADMGPEENVFRQRVFGQGHKLSKKELEFGKRTNMPPRKGKGRKCIYQKEKEVQSLGGYLTPDISLWCNKHKQFLAGQTCDNCPDYKEGLL
jgi:hypothetical protein